ncbi:Ldh family oxidoreductase [Kribbella sp. NPDC049227]|uniref:Ldh family oxidoreductase n=1 Tax=Kribbella sp. NPDC049227 TaxID=3364113 RepID=UPI003722CAA5
MTASLSVPTAERIEAGRLHEFGLQVFEKCGMPPADAQILVDHLVWADLRGISGLGANKIPEYVARLNAGVISATGGALRIAFQRGGFLVVDAEDSFGHVVGYRVMQQVIATARSTRVSAALIRNTTSTGALGYFASMAVPKQMIGLAIKNRPSLQPSSGPTEKVEGNQEFAVASPAGDKPPLLLDMATSAITLARIHDVEQRGELLPEGVAMTADGRPTTDPVEALDGMLLPMSGDRGFGLAPLWKVLTGVLSANAMYSTAVTSTADTSRPQPVSMLLLVVDPTVSMPYETFAARVDDLISRIHDSHWIGRTEPFRLHDERSAGSASMRRAASIQLPATLRETLAAIAADLGVAPL